MLEWDATSGGVRNLRDVPETLFVHVRQVDHDLQFVAGLYQPFSGIGEAGADIRCRREAEGNAVGEDVRAAPDRAERAKASLVENMQRIQIGADRFCALDMEDGGKGALCHRAADLGGRAADFQRTA
ncbi:hypothetical protein QE433_004729 [Agrobacterium tumefaciens]|nr:hypothetical protein [Agrobacterium tumefaciens]